jgi:hypothetical protein
MKINFYFDWTCAKNPDEHPYEEFFGGHWGMSDLWFRIYRKLKIKYPDVEFCAFHTGMIVADKEKYASLTNGGVHYGSNSKYGVLSVVIENAENKKYIALTMMDYIEDFHCHVANWDMENCVEILTSIGGVSRKNTYLKFERCDTKVTPALGSYLDYPDQENLIDKIYKEKNTRIFSEKPRFIGYLYGVRLILKDNGKLDIIDKNGYGLHTNESFLRELDKYKVNLSLNSAAEISGRDFEIMGLGSVNLRCLLNCSAFHNPLIPDYHYAAINIYDHSDIDKISDAFLEKYEYIKSNPDFLNFIAENGRKWYEENVPREKASSVFVNELIDLNKLI